MKHTVHFLPDDISVSVDHGENLLSATAMAGIFIQASCGGDGVCGKCKVQVSKGQVDSPDSQAVSFNEKSSGIILACVSSVTSDITIELKTSKVYGDKDSRIRPKITHNISAASLKELAGTWSIDPPVRKLYLQLDPPSLEDNISDTQRLIRAIQHASPTTTDPSYDHPELIRELPHILREASWEVTVILLQSLEQNQPEQIIAVEAGNTTDILYGLAVDLGTTTLSGALVDLNTGRIISEASAYNRQTRCGEDIISRIVFSQRTGGLKTLQHHIISTVNDIIENVCRDVIISPSDISYIMAAGNTVIAHLLLGIDPKYIREAPYVPSVSDFPLTKAAPLGILAHPSVRLFLYPCVAAYLGGDIVAGVHASQMHTSEKITLFIDIGTNGEIVIGNSEWMVCAACSAGPAFEGGGIKFGMRASNGAIENFHIHPITLEPMIVTIGNTNPKGICGSGLIAIVPELLEAGVIDPGGKIDREAGHERIRKGGDGWEYVIAWARDTQTGEDIVLTEIDLENLIRAKGAMFAGYQTLLGSVGLSFSDLDRVILAGNFGAHIDLEKAIAIGLLPDLDRNSFFYLGNASLLGCRVSITDHGRFRQRINAHRLLTHIELSDNNTFMDNYMAALFLPHTDLSLFPSRGKSSEHTKEAGIQEA